MKASLLAGFRAFMFAIGAFILLVVSGIKVRSSYDVAGFLLGMAVFWFLLEKVVLSLRKNKRKPGPPR